MAGPALSDSPSPEDLIARAKALGGGQFVPPPEMAGQMAEDLKAIASREKGAEAKIGGEAPAQDTKQAISTPEDLLPIFQSLEDSKDTDVSPKGAVGKYQIMEGTARGLGFDPDERKIPAKNKQMARDLLAQLSKRYEGDLQAIAVAYNANPRIADKWLSGGRDNSTLPGETQKYLAKLEKIRAQKPDTTQSVADREALLREAAKRGLLTGENKALYDEAVRRHIIAPGAPAIQGRPAGQYTVLPSALSAVRAGVLGANGPLPDVDYKTGTDWMDKFHLDQADTPDEKRLYLDKKYGKENVSQDPDGIFYVNINGRKVAPGGGGFWARFSAANAAEAPVYAGAAAGAALAPESIPLAAVGAAVGGGAGKLAIEGQKRLQGLSSKDILDTLGVSARTGEEMGVAELGGQAVSRGIGRLSAGRVPSWFSGTTAESRALTAMTTERGATPPIISALPDSRTLQWHQALGEKLFGSMIDKKNLGHLEQEMASLLKSTGMTENEIPLAMQQILDPSAAMSTEALGKVLGEKVQGYAAGLGEEALAANQAAQSMLDKQLENLRLLTRERTAAGQLAKDVSDKFIEARSDFSRSMQRVYSRIDNLVGDQPVVPTFLAKRKARNLLANMPESDIKKIVQEIADMKPRESFENMQRLRTRLWEMGEPDNLAAAGLIKRDLRDLRKMVDRSFDQAFLGNAPEAARILRKADAAYKDGIVKFQDEVLNRVVDSLKTGLPPDPGAIAKMLMQSGSTARITEFKRLLGGDIWKRVVAQDWRDMLEVSSEKGEIDPMRFFKEVEKRARTGVLETAYGTQTGAAIEQFARRNAVLSEKLPLSALARGDNFEGAMQAVNVAQKKLSDFVDENFLGALADPSIPKETIYSMIVQSGKDTLLERVLDHFTRDSPEITQLRQTAMKVLLKKTIVEMETGAGRTVGPNALRNALKTMTPKMQEMLFPDGLADDLNLVANQAQFLFPKGAAGDMAAGLYAGALKHALPFGAVAGGALIGGLHGAEAGGTLALVAYAHAAAFSWMLANPSIVRWLANGIRSRDTVVRELTDQTFRGIVRAGALGMLPGQQAND